LQLDVPYIGFLNAALLGQGRLDVPDFDAVLLPHLDAVAFFPMPVRTSGATTFTAGAIITWTWTSVLRGRYLGSLTPGNGLSF